MQVHRTTGDHSSQRAATGTHAATASVPAVPSAAAPHEDGPVPRPEEALAAALAALQPEPSASLVFGVRYEPDANDLLLPDWRVQQQALATARRLLRYHPALMGHKTAELVAAAAPLVESSRSALSRAALLALQVLHGCAHAMCVLGGAQCSA
jgi:hypothetical protein